MSCNAKKRGVSFLREPEGGGARLKEVGAGEEGGWVSGWVGHVTSAGAGSPRDHPE